MRKEKSIAVRAASVLTVAALLIAAVLCAPAAADTALGTTIYLRTDKTNTPYIYYWINGRNDFSGWPGSAMTSIGNDVYSYELPCDISELSGVLFNYDSSGNKMTVDDVVDIYGNLYDFNSAKWEIFVDSPVKIKSFGIDINTVYVGSQVVLSANAQSDQGGVEYQFSADGSVISDYSSEDHAVWQPDHDGDVDLLFEVKDSSGNVNSREMTVTVDKTAGKEEPIFLGASPINGSVIKAGESVTVSVSGAGGEVNNNILFYKTEITAPDGTIVNTPYYKTDGNVEFTPQMNGEYKIKMFIQNNTIRNTTTSAVYTYICTDGIDPIDTDTESTDTDKKTSDSDIRTSDTDKKTSDSDIRTSDTDKKTSDSDIRTSDTDRKTSDSDIRATDSDRYDTKPDGDYDGDGKVELEDAYAVQQDVVRGKRFTEQELRRADMNNDGRLTLKDATLIQRAALK